jgi:tetratricopeptide (TPR) repeat protein
MRYFGRSAKPARLVRGLFAGAAFAIACALLASAASAAGSDEPEAATKPPAKTAPAAAKHDLAALGKKIRADWPSAPDGYIQAVALIERKLYRRAIEKLNALNMPGSANVLNYLGFAHRQMGQVDKGIGFYIEALRINPDHKGANEYIGEAYLTKNDLTSALRHLAALERICGIDCHEYKDLAADIRAHKARQATN